MKTNKGNRQQMRNWADKLNLEKRAAGMCLHEILDDLDELTEAVALRDGLLERMAVHTHFYATQCCDDGSIGAKEAFATLSDFAKLSKTEGAEEVEKTESR